MGSFSNFLNQYATKVHLQIYMVRKQFVKRIYLQQVCEECFVSNDLRRYNHGDDVWKSQVSEFCKVILMAIDF